VNVFTVRVINRGRAQAGLKLIVAGPLSQLEAVNITGSDISANYKPGPGKGSKTGSCLDKKEIYHGTFH
jgi:hypothetical protein